VITIKSWVTIALVALFGGGCALSPSTGNVASSPIHIFASPDPDSVNSFGIETPEGLVVVSAQRVRSEAQRAVTFFKRLGQPVVAIVIPVPHTDHFGGLSTLRQAFPEAKVYASQATIDSMRTDGQGYVASRKKALGDDFPSQDEVNRNLPTEVLRDGQTLVLGGLSFRIVDLPDNNAPTNTLLYSPTHRALFASEVVENSVTGFMRDANLDRWIIQIESLRLLFPELQSIYGAHGFPGPARTLVDQQLGYLKEFRTMVDSEIVKGGIPSELRRKELAASFDLRYPEYAQVARLPRTQLIEMNIQWQAEKRAKR
jgi:glyoxylase-like metal-dependent hydrolase (beta-lactamase superfamily II)